jgi:hypothetical protein
MFESGSEERDSIRERPCLPVVEEFRDTLEGDWLREEEVNARGESFRLIA